jgi:hypothetical protein
MSIKPLPTPGHETVSQESGASPLKSRQPNPLKNCFAIKNGAWFVTNANDEQAGPYSNKADAQMALVYYVARTCWPSAKQLREFTRARH